MESCFQDVLRFRNNYKFTAHLTAAGTERVKVVAWVVTNATRLRSLPTPSNLANPFAQILPTLKLVTACSSSGWKWVGNVN